MPMVPPRHGLGLLINPAQLIGGQLERMMNHHRQDGAARRVSFPEEFTQPRSYRSGEPSHSSENSQKMINPPAAAPATESAGTAAANPG